MRIRRLGQQSRLDASSGAEVPDRGRIVACRHEGVGHGERRQYVAGGAAPCDHGVGPVGHRALMRRATLRSSPAAVMLTNNELPPAEKNGRVRPVTGRKPTTPPMLTIA